MAQTIHTPPGRPRLVRILFWVIVGILTALLFAALFAVAVTLLWNWLMTDLFGLKPINYFQAFGLILLARLLVGGWHQGQGKDGHSPFSPLTKRGEAAPPQPPNTGRGDSQTFWHREGREAFGNDLKKRQGETEA